MPYYCIVCDNEVGSSEELTTCIVPNHRFSDGKEVMGWQYKISSCKDCESLLGRPVKALTRPYELNFAVFSKTSEPVLLKGSYSKD